MAHSSAAHDIIRQITDAFAAVEQPPRDALINNHCCECAETSAAYDGKRWSDVTLADVLRGRETALLTLPARWRYGPFSSVSSPSVWPGQSEPARRFGN
jgi:hypothetical protein